MFNLLCGEFYKWKKSKSFWVCTAVAVVIVAWFYLMVMVVVQQSGEPLTNPDGSATSVLEMVKEINSTGIGMIFVAIFTCIWGVGEYSNGAIKNLAGKGVSKEKVFLAKYISSLTAAVVMNLICMLAIAAFGCICLGTDTIGNGFLGQLSIYIGIQLLFGAAASGIIVTVCEFTRNMAAGISISLCIFLLSDILVSGLDLLLSAAELEIKASSYWVISQMNDFPIDTITGDNIGYAVNAIVMWAALSVVLGMVHFKRADVV